MDDREGELATTVEDLSETLEELRAELREPPRGPLGLPRPPTPGEFLRFTERYTIPAVISLLEASIRTLELLAAAIRVADGRPLEGAPPVRREATAAGTDRIATASRRTLGALDEALAELQSAAAGGEPESPELQRLLSEARDLRAEVDDRLAEATTAAPATAADAEPVNIEVTTDEDDSDASPTGDPVDDGDGDEGVDVDVDRELESIKREFDESERAADTEDDTDDADDADVADDYRERHDAPEDRDRDDEGPDEDRGDGGATDDSDFGGADDR